MLIFYYNEYAERVNILRGFSHIKGENVKIGIIDSGVILSHPKVRCTKECEGLRIVIEKGEVSFDNFIEDQIGHGTAVTSIITRFAPNSSYFFFKIFDQELVCDYKKLLLTLYKIKESFQLDILHLSLGIVSSDIVPELKKIIDEIDRSGTIIVAAFDNSGSISYPAAFENVIGVDTSANVTADYDYEYIESSEVNIRAKGCNQKVAWKDPSQLILQGASFAAAYVTGFIAKIIETGAENRLQVLETLKEHAKLIVNHGVENSYIKDFKQTMPEIKTAVTFPFNKEIHSIVCFSKLLSFELVDVYCSKYLGNIGRKTSALLKASCNKDYIVKNIESINWDSFDTLILGHTDSISNRLGYDISKELIHHCIEKKKNIYAFDDISRHLNFSKQIETSITFPQINKDMIPLNRFGKLFEISKPVLGIFGTSSKQGKFTVQLTLREQLLKDGYHVGQLGTEPSSLLFGFDEVYPMGYNSTVNVSGYDAVQVINQLLRNIEITNPEIILVGSQSGTVPYATNNLSFYTTPQLEFLLGTCPDAVILCVNHNDEIGYIKRTIQTIESLISCNVIAIVVFPKELSQDYTLIEKKTRVRSEDFVELIKTQLNKKVFRLDNAIEMNQVYEEVLNYFEEG
ncbi:S8 family serine peptidase [Paenibacillus sp. FSL H8-0317]|uniref:S8 family serine peptidase n=1 Tax=Paenibacillus sp. FSL H8-0317 TaxID=2921385 RepID=UPI003251FD2A